ncbi:MAG TPA: C45 family peptidase [Verrucomicrobiae bacterium]
MKRFKKWCKRLLLLGLFLMLAGGTAAYVAVRCSVAVPPPLPANASILSQHPEVRGDKTWLGQSWRSEREGLPVVCLKGAPLDIGYADGVLMEEKMHTLEREFLVMIQGYVPQHWVMELLKNYVIFRNRHLSDYVPEEYRLEIYGTTLGCQDIHPEEGPFYNRLLNYHAAHDVSYMLIDNPFVTRAGCTAFGAWSNATVDAHLIAGRNFDWEAAEVFSRDRVVEMFEPSNGIPFISLAWAGMKGVVSGMNRAGVSVTINGAPSRLPDDIGTPVAMVAREVLQQAHDLAEALAIIRKAKVFVSTIWLVGSRADGHFVVVEKTPETMAVRQASADSIVCPNHFETDDLKEGERNTNYMVEATSVAREQRLTELLQQSGGRINPAVAAGILRDRNLAGGKFAGNGNRGALNALIATHAVVMDLTAGIFWAAAPPYGMGKYVAFDVNDFDHVLPALTIPADPALASGEVERALEARQLLRAGRRALKDHDAKTALDFAKKAEALNPGLYENAMLSGRAWQALGRSDEAAAAFGRALAGQPAFAGERRQLEEWLRTAKATN